MIVKPKGLTGIWSRNGEKLAVVIVGQRDLNPPAPSSFEVYLALEAAHTTNLILVI